MSARAIVLVGIFAGAGALLWGFNLYRHGTGRVLDRLEVEDLGLDLLTGCCAFVLFSTDSCAPCKAAFRVVKDAAGATDGLTEVTTIDALQRSDLALRYDVRTVPTVFLITASGHVVRRWREVPDPADVASELAAIGGLRQQQG